ncbi:citrate synthase [Thermoflavimicrobium daqui]|jgi:citrate synthase|uniref:Citrate synthase n=1 Tax=Thermoflavimicrobium daqui TaxID=2137476 RepID=A0A364K980_9BACL|nr:citrate synthase [Thermoflavimicrobium daqui]RAL26838.1 citrate synthase [Thermoflavimicrobium daqui]
MTVAKGLEGVVALESQISSIVDGVLTYRGYDIDDLAEHAQFEEVTFLLWKGRLPQKDELDQLKKDLDNHATLPDVVLQQLREYPKDAHPMAVLRTAVSALAMFDQDADKNDPEVNYLKAVKLTAKIPTIITAYARLRKGLEPVSPKAGLGFAGNFLYMLNGEEPTDVAKQALDKALTLHADHELNASTFAARVAAGTLADMYSSITAAIGALKGPLHGGANEAVMKMLGEIDSIELVESYIQGKLDRKEKIMGFGHRVYKNGDPRAKHLKEMSRQLGQQVGNPKWFEMSNKIEHLVVDQKGLKPNVDFYSASVYTYLGIDKDLFTPIFAMSRITGWTAHVMEQYADNRLIRPRAEYTGLTNQSYVPVDQR